MSKNPSINGKQINLSLPSISTLKKNLNYIRGEADSMALELRLHDSKIHLKYLGTNKTVNQIFNAIEQSRIEAKGSLIFKGIKSNIFNKHKIDINNKKPKEDNNLLIDAFKYVSYVELTNQILPSSYTFYKKLLQNKLGDQYSKYIKCLKENINDQEKYANQIQAMLDNLGLLNSLDNNDSNKDKPDNEDITQDNKTNNTDNYHLTHWMIVSY